MSSPRFTCKTDYNTFFLSELELQMGLYPTADTRADWENPPAKKWLTNEDLLAELQTSKEEGRITNEFIRLLSMMVDRLGQRRVCVDYQDWDDMRINAMRHLVERQQCMKFNPEQGNNPFAYYTVIIKNAFVQILHKKKRERLIAQGHPDRLMVSRHDHAMKVV